MFTKITLFLIGIVTGQTSDMVELEMANTQLETALVHARLTMLSKKDCYTKCIKENSDFKLAKSNWLCGTNAWYG